MDLMQRISHGEKKSEEMLEDDGILTLGFSEIVKTGEAEALMAKALKLEKREFAKETIDFGVKHGLDDWLSRVRSYYLYNFFRLAVGDKVVVPFPKEFSIFEVTSAPYTLDFEKYGKYDLGFGVDVKPIKEHFQRDEYLGAALTSKLKFRGANLQFTEGEIEGLISNIGHKTIISDFTSNQDQIVEIVQAYIKDLKPAQFELLIKNYLENLGADETSIPGKGDKIHKNDPIADVDVMARFNNLGIAVYVQAKHYEGEQNRQGIDQLLAYQYAPNEEYQALVPVKWLITTAEVKGKLMGEAENAHIRVIQGDEFAALLVENGLKIDADTFNNHPE
ncbi:MAG: restriction endonuclease [Lactobacillus sp.]|jgi:hypothetical protein|nr:restriction endonuclease [Lactobacillus sp.]